ncbi:hypothetical protein NKJ90_10495 [Mesorhizobium sp. M0051]|uniref:HipA family kinase n=1 Tax=unclassified Mesorhizobium TaxID=325217 RepID=UPI0003CF9977|nr:HipA family kinase [Mesorhizobium sp. LNHC252B00]ESY72045.1 hypothetical protein X743_18580 [Mesorhizobium sp. LNHC252B00]
MTEIRLATVLLGASPFKEGNINETYRGQVLVDGGEVRQAVIKDLHLVELCNELLAFCLAKHVGIPIPDAFIGLVRPGILSVTKAPELPNGSRLVFVSTNVKVPNLTFRLTGADTIGRMTLLAEVAKWANLGKLYAFDTWIANVDRHCGNLLFGSSGDAWIIDHGHGFSGPAWSEGDLDPAKDFKSRLEDWMTPMLSAAQRGSRKQEATAMEASISGFDATEVSKISRIVDLLPPEKVTVVKAFIEGRVARITPGASKALGLPVIV